MFLREISVATAVIAVLALCLICFVRDMKRMPKQERKRLDGAKARLMKEHGYDDYTAEKLLVEVALSQNWKGE